MPHLSWPSKTSPSPVPGTLIQSGIVYPYGSGYPDEQPDSQLIYGDNLRVMSALLAEWEGKIDLIYADPPFFTNRHYPARIGRGEDSRKPQGWQLAAGYPDSWADIDSYLDMLYPRLALMHRLLSPKGTLYLHLDWHASAYARLLLDEIFGPERLLNEIIWVYHGPSPIRSAFNRKHDTLLAYTKSDRYTFNVDDVRQPYDPNTVKTFASSRKAGFGKIPDLKRGKVPEDWWYFPVVARLHSERTGYPTQKPAALLERIILASSNSGDVAADFFCGSGTTAAAAARLGRRFIASDAAWRAVTTTRSRLVSQRCKSFWLMREQQSEDPYLPATAETLRKAVQIAGNIISIDREACPNLDYWEVDPDWNGKSFRSAWQALRPRSNAPIVCEAELANPPAGRVCVRLSMSSGEQLSLQI